MKDGKRESYMSRMEIGPCFEINNGRGVRRLTARKAYKIFLMTNLTGL